MLITLPNTLKRCKKIPVRIGREFPLITISKVFTETVSKQTRTIYTSEATKGEVPDQVLIVSKSHRHHRKHIEMERLPISRYPFQISAVPIQHRRRGLISHACFIIPTLVTDLLNHLRLAWKIEIRSYTHEKKKIRVRMFFSQNACNSIMMNNRNGCSIFRSILISNSIRRRLNNVQQ